jgi:hypothetical protein
LTIFLKYLTQLLKRQAAFVNFRRVRLRTQMNLAAHVGLLHTQHNCFGMVIAKREV